MQLRLASTNNSENVSAVFRHTCGHDSVPMLYQAKEFAEMDKTSMEGRTCWKCRNQQAIAQYQSSQVQNTTQR